jgi:hypothetical protein
MNDEGPHILLKSWTSYQSRHRVRRPAELPEPDPPPAPLTLDPATLQRIRNLLERELGIQPPDARRMVAAFEAARTLVRQHARPPDPDPR